MILSDHASVFWRLPELLKEVLQRQGGLLWSQDDLHLTEKASTVAETGRGFKNLYQVRFAIRVAKTHGESFDRYP